MVARSNPRVNQAKPFPLFMMPRPCTTTTIPISSSPNPPQPPSSTRDAHGAQRRDNIFKIFCQTTTRYPKPEFHLLPPQLLIQKLAHTGSLVTLPASPSRVYMGIRPRKNAQQCPYSNARGYPFSIAIQTTAQQHRKYTQKMNQVKKTTHPAPHRYTTMACIQPLTSPRPGSPSRTSSHRSPDSASRSGSA